MGNSFYFQASLHSFVAGAVLGFLAFVLAKIEFDSYPFPFEPPLLGAFALIAFGACILFAITWIINNIIR